MRCKLRLELAVGSVGGQLRGDEECPFNGVTSSSRVRWKVPESDARSVVRLVPVR